MTNLVVSRPPASSAEPAPPPNKALLIGIPLFVVVLVVVATLQGNGIFILGFLGFVVALLISVSLHEGGHFWTARKFGMKATHFFVGFGPTIWSRRRGETEWGFKAIPAGGFVKIVGMTQLEEVDPGDEDRAFWKQPAKQRIVVLAAGSTVHFILAVVLVLLSALFIGKAVELNPGIGSIAACVPAAYDDTCQDAGAVPAPAETSGLEAGDIVIAVDGEPVEDSLAFLRAVRASPGEPIALTVERDGSPRDVTVTPVAVERPVLSNREEDRDRLETVGAIGVGIEFRSGTERLGPIEAVGHSVDTMGQIVTGIWTTFSEKLGTITEVYGPERDPEGFIGIYGAGRISGEVLASDETLAYKVLGFLGLIAGLNFFVGVFNLLPLLPLDGGHIAVLLYEQARDKLKRLRGYTGELVRVDLTKLLPVTYAVVVFFAGFTLWLLGADIVNPITLNP